MPCSARQHQRLALNRPQTLDVTRMLGLCKRQEGVLSRRSVRLQPDSLSFLPVSLTAPASLAMMAGEGGNMAEPSDRVQDIQRALQATPGLDGWLFYDFRGSDPLASRVLQLDPYVRSVYTSGNQETPPPAGQGMSRAALATRG